MSTGTKVLLTIGAMLLAASLIASGLVYNACMAEMRAWWFCIGLIF